MCWLSEFSELAPRSSLSYASRATGKETLRIEALDHGRGEDCAPGPLGGMRLLGYKLLRPDCTSPVFKHGIRVGSSSPGPVISALLADWSQEKLKEAKESGSLIEASEVANVVMFMLTRPRGMTIRDGVMLPTNFDL